MAVDKKLRRAGLITIALFLTPLIILLSVDFIKDIEKYSQREKIKKAEAKYKANLKVEEMVKKTQKQ